MGKKLTKVDIAGMEAVMKGDDNMMLTLPTWLFRGYTELIRQQAKIEGIKIVNTQLKAFGLTDRDDTDIDAVVTRLTKGDSK